MYIHTDALGSPVARTNQQGQVISRTRYEPYGATAAGQTPTIGFTGHVNDPDTQLIYMQQRYYDPYAGRFLSTDPVLTDAKTGDAFNRYVYANLNPYKNVDPDGRQARGIEINCMVGNCETYRYDNGSPSGPLPDSGSNPGAGPGSFAAGAAAGAGIGLAISGACDGVTLGACVLANPLIIGGSALAGGLLNYIAMASTSNSASSTSSGGPDNTGGAQNKAKNDGADLKKLSPGEIKKLENAGFDAHTLKGSSSKFDLYKDKAGNVYQLLKGGRGEASPVNVNIKTLPSS